MIKLIIINKIYKIFSSAKINYSSYSNVPTGHIIFDFFTPSMLKWILKALFKNEK